MRRSLLSVGLGLVVGALVGVGVAGADTPTRTYSFSSSAPIVFNWCFGTPGCAAPLPATPYPAQINVSGVTGHVINVTLTLRNFALYGDSAGDVEAELEGPSGASVVMAGAGGAVQPGGSDLTFSGGYPALTDARVSGTYSPTVSGTPSFPSGPPPAAGDLSQAVNQDPNGTWSLWVATSTTLVTGAFGGGWQLNITTTPYADPSPITLNAPPTVGTPARPADTYPSQLTVSGLSGVISSVHPTLAGFHTTAADDLDFLLSDPARDGALLMGDAGGRSTMGFALSNLSLGFDDGAPSGLPNDTRLFGGVFRPSVYADPGAPAPLFPAPAPAGPYTSALSTFAGRDPNGTWALYGTNDESRADSSLTRGWDLDIATRPASPVQLSASAVTATRGAPLALTITRSAPASGPATVALGTGAGTAVPGSDYTPVSSTVTFARGETTKTVIIPVLAAGRGGTFSASLSSPTDDAALAAPASATITVPAPGGGPPPPPVGAPSLRSLRLAPSSFHAASRGATITRASRPTGTTVSYTDSQAATTTFTVTGRAAGIKQRGRCVAVPRRRPHGRVTRCTRAVSLGTFRHPDRVGANRWHFTGRIGGHALARASYTLTGVPRNRSGRSGRAAVHAFRVL